MLFYLKLLLKSVRNEGKLIRFVGEEMIPYDPPSLAKLTDTDVDTVKVAMDLFNKIGLVQLYDSGEIYLSQINELVGSETESAIKMRRKRARDKQKKMEQSHCDQEVTQELEEVTQSKSQSESLETEKDSKENKDSVLYSEQNQKLEQSIEQVKGKYEVESDLITQLIIDKRIEKEYGHLVVQNFVKFSGNDFEVFKTFYDKLEYSRQSVEKELGVSLTLYVEIIPEYEIYQEVLSKAFWKAMQRYREGKIKKDINNYLFGTFRGTWKEIAENIRMHRQARQRNKGVNSKDVLFENWIENAGK